MIELKKNFKRVFMWLAILMTRKEKDSKSDERKTR